MKIFLLCLFTTLLALPVEVIFMRHGHKASVPKGTKQKNNWMKSLTEHGREDAKSIRDFLKKYTSEHDEDIVLYASPFRRTIMTLACFAKAKGKKIRLDRSLGENNSKWKLKGKEDDHGVWDPKIKKPSFPGTEQDCHNPGNKCKFSNRDCSLPLDIQGTRGPNCDLPIWEVVNYCGESKVRDQQEILDIIDPNYTQRYALVASGTRCNDRPGDYIQQIDGLEPADCARHCQDIEGCVYFSFFTNAAESSGGESSGGHCNLCGTNAAAESSDGDTYKLTDDKNIYESWKWYGRKGAWENTPRVRAEYAYDNIINNPANNGKRIIIASHGLFMDTFFKMYVSGGRKNGIWNTGTMNFLQPTEEGSKKPLKVVGERFSFASTNDMLWTPNTFASDSTNEDNCLSTDATPKEFGYLRSPWQGRSLFGFNKDANVPMIARKREEVSGLVLELKNRDDEACNGARLEYMDCTERKTDRKTVCLFAGWHAEAGIKCINRRLVMFENKDSAARQTQNHKESWFSPYSADTAGYWLKVTGLNELQGGCQIQERDALVSRAFWSEPQVSEFSFESKELHQIALNGEWAEESRVFPYNDVRLYKQNWRCEVLRHVRGPTTPEACADAVLADSRCSTDHFTWSDSSLVGVPCKCVRDCGSTGVWSNVYDTYSMTRGEGRRELNSFDDIPFGFEANSEFKVEGDISMDFEFSPNPNILMKIVPPFMDVKAGMQFSLQKDIEHDINMNQYELTEKKILYSDFFLVGAVPITVKVLAQAVADIHIKGKADANGLVSMNLDGQIRISDEFVQVRLDLLEGELDYNTIEPTLQLTGFNDIWNFDFHAMANLDIDVKVGIQLEVLVADAIAFEFTPSVQASTILSVGTPNSPMFNGEASWCPSLIYSASAQLGTSMDIGAGLKREGGNDFNLITALEENCSTFEDQLTGGLFDWIDDWHAGLSDLNSEWYYDDQEGYSAVCSAVFDVLEMSIAWDGSVKALNGLHFDLNLYEAELFRFDSPQICMGPEAEAFEVDSRGHFSRGVPMSTPRPTTTARPTPSPTSGPTTSPTTGPSPKPSTSPTPSPTPSPTTSRPTTKPTESPTDENTFCLLSSDCAKDKWCAVGMCAPKLPAWSPCIQFVGACEEGYMCGPTLMCIPDWFGVNNGRRLLEKEMKK